MATQHWKEIVTEKRGQAATYGLLPAKELDITETDVEVLLEKLAKGTWTSVEVTTAFAKRAIVAHHLVNCLTEIFIDQALVRAAELDEHLETTGQVIGALHGLPISLNDQINIKGLESTMGYVSWIGKYADKNSVLADILESCGAVLYVKTNIPQTLMWVETFNHVFGRTYNPYNRSLTSGGSSGGEGALIGVGSDIGGSIRVPSAFCGLYGLRPSYSRIPYAGCVNSLEGQDSVVSVLGPLANNLKGVTSFMKSVLSQKPWLKDPLVTKKPWSEEEYKLCEHGGGKMCFAIMWHDDFMLPHPPVIRALEETKKALVDSGNTVIDWKPWKHAEINQAIGAIFAAEAAEDYRVATQPTGEPVVSSMSLAVDNPNIMDPNVPAIRPFADNILAYELWQVQKKRRNLREEYLDHWNATVALTGTGRPVDAIIAPCAPYVASPHGMNMTPNYTMVWNALDYPALVLPTGLYVDPVLDAKKPAHEFFSEMDRVNYEFYDPAKYAHAPIAIQLIGRTSEEEGVIGMGEVVDSALQNYVLKCNHT